LIKRQSPAGIAAALAGAAADEDSLAPVSSLGAGASPHALMPNAAAPATTIPEMRFITLPRTPQMFFVAYDTPSDLLRQLFDRFREHHGYVY